MGGESLVCLYRYVIVIDYYSNVLFFRISFIRLTIIGILIWNKISISEPAILFQIADDKITVNHTLKY
jgi:hypothetical protein